MHSYDVIVLGGGAAGLMCAIVAGARGRRVLVLERSNKVGKKILMSGGGRCNFTNINIHASNFISANPHFCKSALSRYTAFDFVALVESHAIPYHEKSAGQLFCDRSSKDIVAMLLTECEDSDVSIITHCETARVEYADGYRVSTDKGRFGSGSLVIATGGLSIPKMGASDFGYRLARQFGLNVLETRAGLVPFTFSGAFQERFAQLAGVSLPARLATRRMSFADDILFTHRGLSGPAALQLSSYWSEGQDIEIDLLPDGKAEIDLRRAKRMRPESLIRTLLSASMPRALVMQLQAQFWPDFAEIPVREIGDDRLGDIEEKLRHWILRPSGTEGYRTAEVTLGGIDSRELSSKTMECVRQPGLYFIGEVVDVTGDLGGFNFQWAWASAQAAGHAV